MASKSDNKTSKNQTKIAAGKYGWFSWEPKLFQNINNATFYMVLMTTSTIAMNFASVGTVQSTIEKRFKLTSKQGSWIIAALEITTIPLTILLTYVGTVGCHRPRWIASFLLISVIGRLLGALPHFTTPVYIPNGHEGESIDDSELCLFGNTSLRDSCKKTIDGGITSIQSYMWLFIVARTLTAFGSYAMGHLGVTFLDDSLTRDKVSLHTAIFQCASVVGPAIGFVLGGYFLSIYTDFASVDVKNLSIDQSDPRWVGAWWLGYIVAAIGVILTTILMSGYPRDLPGAKEMRLKKVNEASGTTEDPTINELTFTFKKKHLLQFSKDLLTNFSFVFLMLFMCCQSIVTSAFAAYGPKYIEVQFSMSAGKAGILVGLLLIPIGTISMIAGGVIIERFKLTFRAIIKMQIIIAIFLLVIFVPACLLHCDNVEFIGVNLRYHENSSSVDLIDNCNENCSCEHLQFNPVCSQQNIQYYTPCHAGCYNMEETTQGKFFHNCSCITDKVDDGVYDAQDGVCSNKECTWKLAVFSVALVLAMPGYFMCEGINTSAILRVVPNSHRLFAMMVVNFAQKFIGSMPGPMLFGVAFDAACLLFQRNPCNSGDGNCYYHDHKYLSKLLLISICLVNSVGCVFIFLTLKLYKPPPSLHNQMVSLNTSHDCKAVCELEVKDSEESAQLMGLTTQVDNKHDSDVIT